MIKSRVKQLLSNHCMVNPVKISNCLILRNGKRFFAFKKPGSTHFSKMKAKENKNIWIFNIGVLSSMFGLVYLMVPFYKKFCQSVGLQGDTHQKSYADLSGNLKSNKNRKFKVIFEGEADPEMGWAFEPEQKELVVHGGETALMFYKAVNNNPYPVIGTAIYNVYPEFANQYFSKIQCFCFNQQLLNPKEEVMMPLYFYFEPEIEEEKEMNKVNEIRVNYRFFKCKKQDLAKLVQENTKQELQNKIMVLTKRRENLKKKNECLTEINKQIENYKIDLENVKSSVIPLT